MKQNKRQITVKKMSLHDKDHHSFIFGLSGDELFEVMSNLTKIHYCKNGKKFPDKLDKSKVSFRRLHATV